MARKPDKRVYVRRMRTLRKLQKRRVWAPVRSRKSNQLQEENLRLLKELAQRIAQA